MPKRRKEERVHESQASDCHGRLVRYSDCWLVRDGELVKEDLWVLDGAVINPQKRWWDAVDDASFLAKSPRSAKEDAKPTTAAVTVKATGAEDARCEVEHRYTVVQCGGHILSSGFYDLQLNGAFGVDFANPEHVTLENLTLVAEKLLAHGVVAFCPTIISSSASTYAQLLPKYHTIRKQLGDDALDFRSRTAGASHASRASNKGSGSDHRPLGNSTSNGKHADGSSNTNSGNGTGSNGDSDIGSPVSLLGPLLLRKRRRPRARVLGLHLEGPFLHPEKKGAHPLVNLRQPMHGVDSLLAVFGGERSTSNDGRDKHTSIAGSKHSIGSSSSSDSSRSIADSSVNNDISHGRDPQCSSSGTSGVDKLEPASCLSGVALVTLAPELPGALDAAAALEARGVLVSMGHSSATYEQGLAGVASGCRMITHLFNAMPTFHHRDPGLVGLLGMAASPDSKGAFSSVAEDQRPHYGLIADGYHAHPASVKLAASAHPEGCVLVTDAISALGLGNGRHMLGDVEVNVSDDKATLAADGITLAGAVLPMDQCVRNYRKFTNCSAAAAITAASSRPARLLLGDGLPLPGSLLPGAPADLVLLHADSFEVIRVFCDGQPAWP